MRKLIFWMIAAWMFCGALFAQNVVGTWQGTLKVNVPGAPSTDLRMVVKVERGADEALKATLFSIDQKGVPPLKCDKVAQKGAGFRFEIELLGATYEGSLNGDSNSMNGNWAQAGLNFPLNMARATPETEWTIPDAPPPVVPMSTNANPSFDVVTIKPSRPNTPGKLFTMRGREILAINTTLNDIITFAFDLHPKQIINAPAWIEEDHYDITGTPDTPGQPNLAQMKALFQKMLRDRFHLVFHRDKKELSVYALTVAKGGHKLKENTTNPNGTPSLAFTRLGTLPARNASMAEFAGVMQMAVTDKPIVDQTGLTGKWDFTLNWTPDATQFIGLGGGTPPPPNPDGPPDLFAAIQQQLGLELKSTRAPADVFVIDKVERPSEN